jgi:SPP1 family predicted phage head-tail adaptor
MAIGGNLQVKIQQQKGSTTNSIGEAIPDWVDYKTLTGWLDLSNGDSKYTHDVKLQESTHIFICDYTAIDRKAEDKRLTVNGLVYDILLIDDPMELHEQLEIYLKYVG